MLVSKTHADKSNTLETFLRNLKLNQPGVTSKLSSVLLISPGSMLSFQQGPSETKNRPGTDHHTSTYRLKWGLLYQSPQQHTVTKTTDGTYKLNTYIFKLKATLKNTNLYIRLHGSMTAFIDFFKGTVCNSRLLSLHVSSLVFIQAGAQMTGSMSGGKKRQLKKIVWVFVFTSSSLTLRLLCFTKTKPWTT